jgi:pimeloyl-ACP methyl ester carboxylesterase
MERDAPQLTTTRLHGVGVELTADVYGEPTDPPVLLLHGGGQTRHAWGNAAIELAAAGRFALSLDLRGHGDSDWAPTGAYDIGSFAADVRAVVHTLEGTPALVGASLGGLASLLAVGETREEIASAIVLVDVAPRIEQSGANRIRDFMRSDIGGFDRLEDAADAISRFLPDRPPPKDLSGLQKNLRQREDGRWYWHWDPRFMDNREGVDGQPGLVDHDRLAAAARRITLPVLLVRGRMSEIVSDESVRELRELVPHAEVVDVAGAGHMVAGDRNDAFNDAVVEFLSRVVPVTGSR